MAKIRVIEKIDPKPALLLGTNLFSLGDNFHKFATRNESNTLSIAIKAVTDVGSYLQ